MSVTDGGRPTGVQYSGFHFPLVAPSEDVRGLLADFYLAYRDPDREFSPPFRLASVAGLTQPPAAGARPAEVVVVDAAGAVVADTRDLADYAGRAFGRFQVHQWAGAGRVVRAVQHATGPDGDLTFPAEFEPAAAVLDERCCERLPDVVTGVRVNDQLLTGAVELENGYNTDLALLETVEKPGQALRQRVQLSAAPGSGAGLYPGCVQAERVVRRINQRGPDAFGTYFLAAAGCYWLSRDGTAGPGGVLEGYPENGLRVNNNCAPCCGCDDYVNTYAGVRRLFDRFKDLGTRAAGARDQHAANVDRWAAERECRAANVLRLSALAYRAGGLAVAAGYSNNSNACLGRVRLEFEFLTSGGGDGVLDPDSVLWYPADGGRPEVIPVPGPYPRYAVEWEPVDAGRAAKVRFRIAFPGVTRADWVRVTVASYVNGAAAHDATTDTTRTFLV